MPRDVAYDGLLEERRRSLHARAGAAVERSYADRLHEKYELLAFHYSRSSERERAADYLELANRKASAQHAMEEALGYFYEALAILEELPDSEENRRRRLTLVLDQTAGFHYLHRHEEYYELLLRHEPLVLEQRDPGLHGAFYQRLAHRQLVFGEFEQARETAGRALELCERSGNHGQRPAGMGLENSDLRKFWFRGGYPEPALHLNDQGAWRWFDSYVRTLSERDLARISSRLTPVALRRLLRMLAVRRGQTINSSQLGRDFGATSKTINDYLDILEGSFLWYRLPPYRVNIGKRLTSAPKGYLADTGLLHHLLDITSLGH